MLLRPVPHASDTQGGCSSFWCTPGGGGDIMAGTTLSSQSGVQCTSLLKLKVWQLSVVSSIETADPIEPKPVVCTINGTFHILNSNYLGAGNSNAKLSTDSAITGKVTAIFLTCASSWVGRERFPSSKVSLERWEEGRLRALLLCCKWTAGPGAIPLWRDPISRYLLPLHHSLLVCKVTGARLISADLSLV